MKHESVNTAIQILEKQTLNSPGVIRPGQSKLRTVYQFSAKIDISSASSSQEVFETVIGTVRDWVSDKMSQQLPERIIDGFDLDLSGQQQVNCVAVPEDHLWCLRLVQPDSPSQIGDHKAVAGRTWTTDFAVYQSDESIQLGVRVLCISLPFATEPITLMRPLVVPKLAKRTGLRDVWPTQEQAWILNSTEDVRRLYELVVSQERKLPVVVLTHVDKQEWLALFPEYLLDHADLAKSALAFAHVVCLPPDLQAGWTKTIGEHWNVKGGGVRVYWPHIDLENDSGYSHPLFEANRVFLWKYREKQSENTFRAKEYLLDKLKEYAATKTVDWVPCMFYPDARVRRAELNREQRFEQMNRIAQDRKAVDELTDLESLYQEEIDALKGQVKQWEELAGKYAEDSEAYEKKFKAKEREYYHLNAQNDALRTSLKAKGNNLDEDIPIPQDYESMKDWVEKYLGGRLILHPRALRGIKDAQFSEIELVYKTVLLLANAYRDMNLGNPEAKEEWETEYVRLGLNFSRSISKERAGEHEETYFVPWPFGNNRRQFLEWHLGKGVSREPRNCFRIYFFWDEDRQQVVVGWLPSHLETRAT